MNFLEERIQRDGLVKEGNVLKNDSKERTSTKLSPLKLPVSASPVSLLAISMCLLFLQRKLRALTSTEKCM